MASGKFDRDQVRYICEQVARIKALPSGATKGRPSDRKSVRGAALDALARRMNCSTVNLYRIAQGSVGYTRAWVKEWQTEEAIRRSGYVGAVNGNGAKLTIKTPELRGKYTEDKPPPREVVAALDAAEAADHAAVRERHLARRLAVQAAWWGDAP